MKGKKFLLAVLVLTFFLSSVSIAVASGGPMLWPDPDNARPCEALGLKGFKVKPESGQYDRVKIKFTDGKWKFNWRSKFKVAAVVVKGGPVANIYKYDDGAFYGIGLHAPKNPNSGKYYDVSYIAICKMKRY